MNKRTAVVIMILLTIAVFGFIIIGVKSSANNETKELQLLHVVMRHGIRTPADTYPHDPYINETFYPIGWGQLTQAGKLELFNVGKFLRGRYDHFLGSHYSPDEYYVQSTDVDRTKASMQLVNAGLWPPNLAQKWGPLDWQPIPIHSEPLSEDNLLLVRKPCAQYHLELDKVMQSPEIKTKLKDHEDLFKNLTLLTGKQINNFDDVQDVYSTLKAEESFNLTLPEFIKPYYPEKMEPPTIFSFILNAYNDKLKRLKGGVLLKKLIGDWRSKIDGSIKNRKMFLYGGHDSTIVNLMRALNVWDPQLPGYAITILLELSKDRITHAYGLEVFLRNSTTEEPHKLTIPGCQTFCPIEKVIELTENVVPANWEEECKSDDPEYTPPPLGGP